MHWTEKLSQKATQWTGSNAALGLALLLVAGWLAAGPYCGFSDGWNFFINSVTSVVTFLMVFLIQRSQNKDSLVIQTKLNELLAGTRASNRLIDIENLSEEQVRELHDRYQELAKFAARHPNEKVSVENLPGALHCLEEQAEAAAGAAAVAAQSATIAAENARELAATHRPGA